MDGGERLRVELISAPKAIEVGGLVGGRGHRQQHSEHANRAHSNIDEAVGLDEVDGLSLSLSDPLYRNKTNFSLITI